MAFCDRSPGEGVELEPWGRKKKRGAAPGGRSLGAGRGHRAALSSAL